MSSRVKNGFHNVKQRLKPHVSVVIGTGIRILIQKPGGFEL